MIVRFTCNIFIRKKSQWIFGVRAITSVGAKFFPFCTSKTYFFYFTHSFLQNTNISLSILQDISIKYYFFSIFLLLFSTTFTYNTRPLFLSVSLFFFWFIPLSLYPSLYPSQQITSLSLFSTFSHSFSKTTNPTGRSTNHAGRSSSPLKNYQPNRLIYEPFILSHKLATQPADPRTTPIGLLHLPIHSSPADPRTKLHNPLTDPTSRVFF